MGKDAYARLRIIRLMVDVVDAWMEPITMSYLANVSVQQTTSGIIPSKNV